MLHARHAAEHGASSVVIRSPDTDVAIVACTVAPKIPCQILFRTGTRQRVRFIDLSATSRILGRVSYALVGLHAFTGCDSTSAFAGRGKRRGYKLVKENHSYCEAMAMLGETFDPVDSLVTECEKFVCALY